MLLLQIYAFVANRLQKELTSDVMHNGFILEVVKLKIVLSITVLLTQENLVIQQDGRIIKHVLVMTERIGFVFKRLTMMKQKVS